MKRQAKWGLLSYIVTIILFIFTSNYFFEYSKISLSTLNFSLPSDGDVVAAALGGAMDIFIPIAYFCLICYLYYLFAVLLRHFLIKISSLTNRGTVRKMRIYNARPIFLTILTTLRQF